MRIRAKIPVRINGIKKQLETEDISEGGCLISGIPCQLKQGQKVSLSFQFEEREIKLNGTIRYYQDGKVEIKFDRLLKGVLLLVLSLKNLVDSTLAFAQEIRKLSRERAKGVAHGVAGFFSFLKTAIFLFFLGSMLFAVLQHETTQIKRKEIAGQIERKRGTKVITLQVKRKEKEIIRQIERKRGTKVITLIHGEESESLGIPIRQHLEIEDAEAILRIIRTLPPEKPIDLILHTPGGDSLPAYQIARALKEHRGKVTVFIPYYAMSSGTLIALAADQIVMDKNAVLGPVDPQLAAGRNVVPAASVIKIPQHKDWNSISDQTVVLFDQAQKSIQQVKNMVGCLLRGRKKSFVQKVTDRLVAGATTHDFPLFFRDAKELGLNVSTAMPEEVYRLMDLFNTGSKAASH